MTHNISQSSATPSAPYTKAARRFASAIEARNLRAQIALFKRLVRNLEKISTYLSDQKEKASPKKARSLLSALNLLLLNGKESLVSPFQEKLIRAQGLITQTSTARHPLFRGVLGQKEKKLPKIDPSPLLPEILSLTKDAKKVLRSLENQRQESKKEKKKVQAASEDVASSESTSGQTRKFKDFLSTVKSRGWHVTETKQEEPKAPVSQQRIDPVSVISSLEVPSDLLLNEDVEIGLIKAPILLSISNSLTVNTLINSIKDAPDIGYSVHHCYSKYYVLDGVVLLGLHRSLARSFFGNPKDLGITSDASTSLEELLRGKKKRIKALIPKRKRKKPVDIRKFEALIPFLQKQDVLYSGLINHLSLNPLPNRMLHHYYCPFFPKGVASDSEFFVESWNFLLKKD